MTQKFIDIDGYQIAYHRKGSGPVVLLVHGVGSYSFLWDDIMRQLAKDYDVIAVDLLGCGASDKPEEVDYSIAAQANILMSFIDKLELAPLHLVGHDIGGGVVQLMAVKRPEQIVDLTMMNPVGYDYWPVQPITTMRLPVIRGLTASVMNSNMLRMVIRRGIFNKQRLTNELMDKFWQPFKTMEGKIGFFQLIRSINNQLLLDIVEQLRQLKLPVLLVRGDADAYLSQKILRDLKNDIPGARLEHIAKAGHFLQIDEPDIVSELLKKFFIEENNV